MAWVEEGLGNELIPVELAKGWSRKELEKKVAKGDRRWEGGNLS